MKVTEHNLKQLLGGMKLIEGHVILAPLALNSMNTTIDNLRRSFSRLAPYATAKQVRRRARG